MPSRGSGWSGRGDAGDRNAVDSPLGRSVGGALFDIHDLKIPKEISDISINVGALEKGDSDPKDLSLREACNKTIHAMNYETRLSLSDKHHLGNSRDGYELSDCSKFKSPTIITEGEYKKKKWA